MHAKNIKSFAFVEEAISNQSFNQQSSKLFLPKFIGIFSQSNFSVKNYPNFIKHQFAINFFISI